MQQRNVLGDELIPCSMDPLTGYYRSGCCENRGDDPGMHVVCCQVTEEFLEFSVEPRQRPGHADAAVRVPRPATRATSGACARRAGPRRWRPGMACPVVLEGTHMSALEFVDLEDLRAHAVA